jgi:hypothetical protein
MTPIFSRSWLMKMAVVPELLSAPVILGLAHQPGLQADVAVTHLALDLGARHECGHRVDDHEVDGSGADQHVHDLERLLAGVGLADQQCVGVDTEGSRVLGIKGVLGVDERRDPTGCLRVGDRVQGHRGLARAFRAVDLDDAPARQAADAERHVQSDRAGRDDFDRHVGAIAEAHHRALAVLLLDLCQGDVERLLPVETCGHLQDTSS